MPVGVQPVVAPPLSLGLRVYSLCFLGPQAAQSVAAVNNDLVDRSAAQSVADSFLFVCREGSSVRLAK